MRVLRSAVDALPRSVLAGPPLPDQSSSLPYAHEMVEACAVATPSAVALVDANGSRSYAEVVHDSELVGAWLVAEGSAPGLAVAMLMGHCAEMLIAQLGVAMSGAACFGLENHFGPQMMRELLQRHGARCCARIAPPGGATGRRAAAGGSDARAEPRGHPGMEGAVPRRPASCAAPLGMATCPAL